MNQKIHTFFSSMIPSEYLSESIFLETWKVMMLWRFIVRKLISYLSWTLYIVPPNSFMTLPSISSTGEKGVRFWFKQFLKTFNFLKNSAQENELNENDDPTHLAVSGDGTWKKCGFSFLSSNSNCIGKYFKNVVDAVIKSWIKNCHFQMKLIKSLYEDIRWIVGVMFQFYN